MEIATHILRRGDQFAQEGDVRLDPFHIELVQRTLKTGNGFGAIFADNPPGGGARFEFELPLDVGAGTNAGTNPGGEAKSPISARRE